MKTRYELLFPKDIPQTDEAAEAINNALAHIFETDPDDLDTIDWRDQRTVWITTEVEIWSTTIQPKQD